MLTQSIAWPTFIYLVVKQRFSTRSKWHCYSTTPFKLWSSYSSRNTNDEKQLWIKQQKSKIASNFLLLCCLIDAKMMMIKTPFRCLDGILRFWAISAPLMFVLQKVTFSPPALKLHDIGLDPRSRISTVICHNYRDLLVFLCLMS